jgi:hypothetical protein
VENINAVEYLKKPVAQMLLSVGLLSSMLKDYKTFKSNYWFIGLRQGRIFLSFGHQFQTSRRPFHRHHFPSRTPKEKQLRVGLWLISISSLPQVSSLESKKEIGSVKI